MTVLWYATRASGTVALVLLTLAIVLGVGQVSRVRSDRWPRFVIDGLHRYLALLAAIFLAVHIATAVLDSFAPISLADAVLPFVGRYRPLWLGLGATAFDLLLALGLTSLVRGRLGARTWRTVHWLGYAVWPVAFLHGLGTGSDIHQGWMLAVAIGCAVTVVGAAAVRLTVGWPTERARRLTVAAVALAYLTGVAIWLPAGPLGPGWARRSGTPTRLLAPADRRPSS